MDEILYRAYLCAFAHSAMGDGRDASTMIHMQYLSGAAPIQVLVAVALGSADGKSGSPKAMSELTAKVAELAPSA